MKKYLVEDLINDLKALTDEQRQMEIGMYDNESCGYVWAGTVVIDVNAKCNVRGGNNIGWVYKNVVGLS